MSKKALLRAATGGLAVAVAAGLVACASDAPAENAGPTKVTVWHTYSDSHAETYQSIVDDFNASQSDVVVEALPQPFADFDSKVMQAVSAGNGPDIIVSSPGGAAQYIDAGLVADLTPYVTDPETGVADYATDIVESRQEGVSQWDGSQRLYPLHSTGPVFFYNKTLFDSLGLSAPTTWTELGETADAITAATGKPAFGFDDITFGVLTIAGQQGVGVVSEDGSEVTFNDPAYVDALEYIKAQLDAGSFRLVGGDQYFSNPFGAEAVASYIGSAAGYPFVEMAVDGKFEVGVAPMPQEGSVPYAPEWGGDYLIFASDETRERAAFSFVKYFTSPEPLSTWDIALGAVPVSSAARETEAFQTFAAENAAIRALVEQLPFTVSTSGSLAFQPALSELAIAIEQALSGQASVADALAKAEAAAVASIG